MKNFISEGSTADMVLGFDVVGGVGYALNDIIIIATRDAKAGTKATLLLQGVVKVKKKTTEAMLPGQKLFWDNATKQVTGNTGGGSNLRFGFTVESATVSDPDVVAYFYALS